WQVGGEALYTRIVFSLRNRRRHQDGIDNTKRYDRLIGPTELIRIYESLEHDAIDRRPYLHVLKLNLRLPQQQSRFGESLARLGKRHCTFLHSKLGSHFLRPKPGLES